MDTIKPVEETDQDQTFKTYVVTSYKLEGESTLKTSLADTREPVTGASEQIDDDNDLPPRTRPEGSGEEGLFQEKVPENGEPLSKQIEDRENEKQTLIKQREEVQRTLDTAKDTIKEARTDIDQLYEALQQKSEELKHLDEMIKEKNQEIELLKRENESLKLQLGQQAWQATEYSSQDHEDLITFGVESLEVSGRSSQDIVTGVLAELPQDQVDKLKNRVFAARKSNPAALGSGAFGTVWEVVIRNAGGTKKAAGKEFKQPANDPVYHDELVTKFCRELQILSALNHEHLVSYLGMCPVPDSKSFQPMLLMELLKTNLHDYLLDGTRRPIPRTKVSILLGISKGLNYLHAKGVLHRDLTARNILLTSDTVTRDPVAKIGDFGNSRIVNFNSQRHGMTPFPEILLYMPPEAVSGQYSYSMDIFSFGHLALFTITQNLFKCLPPSKVYIGDELKALSEVRRRSESFDIMCSQLGMGEDHILVSLIKKCLDDVAEKRPSANQLTSMLDLKDSELFTDSQVQSPDRLYEDVDLC